MKPVGKSLHAVYFPRTGDLLSALPIRQENRNPAAHQILHVDFRARIVFVTDDHGGATDIFHARVFHPKFVEISWVDGNRARHILELWANQRQPGLVLANGRLALALEAGVNDRELPAWRWFPSPNAVLAAIKVNVLRHVSAIVDAREARTDVEIHVRQKTVLCIARAHANRARIPMANFDVDIASR